MEINDFIFVGRDMLRLKVASLIISSLTLLKDL
jgi:hypothetical protein